MTCAQCGTGLPAAARFCPGCGAPQQVGCVSCAAELPDGARFCPSCGAPQSGDADAGSRPAPGHGPAPGHELTHGPVAQRRVTSVLFGDLVGFTTLAEGRDQEDVRELLARYFETSRRIIERYGGVVEKFIGDAVMAVWGVPTANEDDAERAVRAGLELVGAVAGLRDEVGVPGLDMRVGIVTGEVAVTLGAEGQGMVAGDAVNTAARVQSVASPGEVWVDETTRSLTQQAISFVDAGEHGLKGKAAPVPLWTVRAVVAGVGGNQRTDGLEAPLVGRDRELRLVKEMFTRTGERATPSLVIVSGEPGVGKSRLAWEFEKYVDGLPATTMWHTGRCVAYGERLPFYALAEAIRARVRLTAARVTAGGATDPGVAAEQAVMRMQGEGAATLAEDMTGLLATALAEIVPDEREREWIGPRLGALLGVGSLAEFTRADLFAAWAAFLRRVGSAAQSVVLQIDDAEHADEGLVAFVEHLMASRFPVFVMMMGRPDLLEEHPELARNPQAMLVNLAPLADRDMQTLLDGLVAGLPESVRQELTERSEGVPLYAVETVRSLVDRDLVVSLDGRYVLADREVDLAAVGAPASLQALITARLDALTDPERTVVEAASVLGQSFHRDHLAEMVRGASAAEIDLDAALARLERGQLVVREMSRWSGDFGQYRFVQAVVPQVAYGMLARRDRKAAHLRAVAIFTQAPDPAGELAPVIAEHLTSAADAVQGEADVPELRARAVQQLVRAADRAEALGSVRECDAYLASARQLTQDRIAGARLDLRRGLALSRAYSTTAAVAVLEPLVGIFDAEGDEVAAGAAAGALADCLSELGRTEEARHLAEPRWAALKDRSDADEAVCELATAMSSIHPGGDMRNYVEAILKVGQRRGDQRMIRRGLRGLAYYYNAAGMPRVARMLYGELDQRLQGDPLERTVNLSNLAASWMKDDVSVALGYAAESAQVVDRLRLVSMAEIVMLNYANALLFTGDWDGALAVAARHDELDRPMSAAAPDFVATTIAVARGETPRVPQWTETDLVEAPVWLRAYGTSERALRLAQAGEQHRVSDAVGALREYFDHEALTDDHAVMWPSLFDLARADHDGASMEGLLELIGDDDLDRSIPVAFRAHRQRALGVMALDQADRDTAVVHLRRGAAFYDEWKAGPLAARSRGELAAALLRSDDEDDLAEGRRLLEDAREVMSSLRATTWLAELDAALERVESSRG